MLLCFAQFKLQEERGYHGDSIKGHPKQTYYTLQTNSVAPEVLSNILFFTPINREGLEVQKSLFYSGETDH